MENNNHTSVGQNTGNSGAGNKPYIHTLADDIKKAQNMAPPISSGVKKPAESVTDSGDKSQTQKYTPAQDKQPEKIVRSDILSYKDGEAPPIPKKSSFGVNPKLISKEESVNKVRTLEGDVKLVNDAKRSGKEIPNPYPASNFTEKRKSEAAEPKKQEVVTPNPFPNSNNKDESKKKEVINASGKSFQPSPIHTYTSDVSKAVKTENTSVIRIAVKEQERKEKERKEIEKIDNKRSRVNVFMITASILFIFFGAGLFYYFIYVKKPNAPAPVVIVDRGLLGEEMKIEVALAENRDDAIRQLAAETSKGVRPSSVKTIVVKDKTGERQISASEFISLVAFNAPPLFLRSLVPEYAFGVSGESASVFIVLKIDSFENAFAGMLKWEKDIEDDLEEVFHISGDTILSNATSTKIIKPRKFEDVVIKNNDVRVLRDGQEGIVFLYTFIGKDTLILTTRLETLEELTERMRRAELVR